MYNTARFAHRIAGFVDKSGDFAYRVAGFAYRVANFVDKIGDFVNKVGENAILGDGYADEVGECAPARAGIENGLLKIVHLVHQRLPQPLLHFL